MAKRKQGHLEGMEPESYPDVDKAAEAYVEVRDSRMAALKEEIEKGDELLALMKEKKIKTYEFDGYKVEIRSLGEKVKVKRTPEDDDEDEDE